MASLGHVAVGMAVGRAYAGRRNLRVQLAFGALAMAPDLDVIAFHFRVPYGAEWGHRGAAHALVFAWLAALIAAAVSPGGVARRTRLAIAVGFTWASHGLLDALTDGGKGVALLWPWTQARYFAPWRPIPVAPIAVGMLSARGLHVLAFEALAFAPFLLFALWPERRAAISGSRSAAAP